MNSNLIPTRIVDKNNKITTVHKRNGFPAAGAGKLGSLKPTIKQAPRAAVSKVPFSTKSGTKMISLGQHSFLARAGLDADAKRLLDSMGGEGSVEMDDELLYEYLRLGIRPSYAAVLHLLSDGDLEKLKADPKFAAALPGDLGTTMRWGGSTITGNEIGGVIDFMSEAGVKPSKISTALSNNLNDERMKDNILAPEQLADLFARFTYSVSKNEKKGTNASRLMDAVMDGRLPYDLIDKGNGVDRTTSSLAVDALYPKTKQHRGYLSDDQRKRLLDDPQMIVDSARVISKHGIHWTKSYATAPKAIDQFGVEACMEYHPEEMLKKRFDGEFIGPEGARAMKEVRGILDAKVMSPDATNRQYINRGEGCILLSGNGVRDVEIYTEDIAEIASHGYSAEQIADSILDKRLNSREILAVFSGKTIPTIAEGWL